MWCTKRLVIDITLIGIEDDTVKGWLSNVIELSLGLQPSNEWQFISSNITVWFDFVFENWICFWPYHKLWLYQYHFL